MNLGTPDTPDEQGIRRYLKQFLSDPRVVDLPRWFWLPILYLIVLRVRPPKLIEKYQLVWGRYDGPIRNITFALALRTQRQLEQEFTGVPVLSAMTYGNPSVSSILDGLEKSNVRNVIFVPLYPQYAGATIGAAIDEIGRAVRGREDKFSITITSGYHLDDNYIQAISSFIRKSKAYRDGVDKIVFSFHGIPMSQVNRGDPYPGQCQETAALIATELGLDSNEWILTYQSRFGPAKWLTPYTDETMVQLARDGIKRVLVVCPGFSVDCLETIEEIRVLNKALFLDNGGESFSYVRALNASWEHARVIAKVVRDQWNQKQN